MLLYQYTQSPTTADRAAFRSGTVGGKITGVLNNTQNQKALVSVVFLTKTAGDVVWFQRKPQEKVFLALRKK